MADKPISKGKDGGKEKPKAPAKEPTDVFVELVGILIILTLLSSFFGGITSAINNNSLFSHGWAGLTAKGLTLADTRPMASVLNPIGGHVIASADSTDVLSDAGGKKIGTQAFGAKGRVLKGPVNVGGVNYYYVDFDSGPDGWVAENTIAYMNTEIRPLKTSDPLNSTVMTAQDGTVLRDAPGGNIIATKPQNARGTITKGPVNKNGTNYYYVQFDDGTSGWVSQNDLLVEAPVEQSGLVKTLLFFWKLVTYVKYLLLLVIVGLIIFLARIIRKLTRIRTNVREKLFPTLATTAPKVSQNPKWERVLTHIESLNENDWRLAIIEADIMLAELLDTMHLNGDSIGEKLKGIEKSDFTTLDKAWEAHKVRNEIAHAGGDFRISQREALRVVELYKDVFKEFQFI
jgi:hypothetical protein